MNFAKFLRSPFHGTLPVAASERKLDVNNTHTLLEVIHEK